MQTKQKISNICSRHKISRLMGCFLYITCEISICYLICADNNVATILLTFEMYIHMEGPNCVIKWSCYQVRYSIDWNSACTVLVVQSSGILPATLGRGIPVLPARVTKIYTDPENHATSCGIVTRVFFCAWELQAEEYHWVLVTSSIFPLLLSCMLFVVSFTTARWLLLWLAKYCCG